MKTSESIKVPKFTLKRLPYYYRCVHNFFEREEEYVSSEDLAKAAQVNPVQVRRDLTLFKAMGIPGVGYRVPVLKSKLEEVLGLKSTNEAVLIGVGKLGRAILEYPGFERYGLNIIASFDADPVLVGKRIGNREVFSIQELPHIINRLNIKVGIVTVPSQAAQYVATLLVGSGVKAIWNFAPVSLEVPKHVIVRNEDLAAGLATLFHHLAD